MAQRQKKWAHAWRARLVAILGAKCNACGATTELELDCVVAAGDAHHKMELSHRMSFYRKQWRNGNLQLLCSRCNSLKGDGPMHDLLALLTTTSSEDSKGSIIKRGEQHQQLRKGGSHREERSNVNVNNL